ncbi:MAG: MATE family efflux transporter, partial [Pseudomonadales bacterium]
MKRVKEASAVSGAFWRNTIPAVVAMLVSGIYIIIDGIFIGQYVGEQGLAAVGLAYPLMTFFTGAGLLVGIGAGALVSFSRGAEDLPRAARALYTGVILLVVAALLSALYIEYSTFFLRLQGASGELLQLAQVYIEVFQYTAFFAIASAALPLLMRNDDSPNLATWLMVAGALLNAVLNYWLLVVLELGIAGAAWATVLSMAVATVAALGYFCSGRATVSLRASGAVFSVADAQQVLAIGSSVLVMHLYAGFVIAVHNALFVQYGNMFSVSAYAVVGYLMSLYYMLSEGVGGGVQPLISYYHGRGDRATNRELMRLAIWVTVGLGVAYYLLLNLFAQHFIHMFNDHTEVVAKADTGLFYHLFGMAIDGLIALATVYFMALQ